MEVLQKLRSCPLGKRLPALLAITFIVILILAIGEPKNTTGKTSTPWLITLMLEHFHQLQNAQPRYLQTVQDLGLSHPFLDSFRIADKD